MLTCRAVSPKPGQNARQQAIADQAKSVNVLVRVAVGATEAETISSIIGTTYENGQYTVMKVQVSAESARVPGLNSLEVAIALGRIA
ncbi:hypothetical protein [Pantoea stewartii]|uniref:hypothetical protein n=1 Tax=Pantoea stewartii TaxID=66269 RepID=UPI0019810ECA